MSRTQIIAFANNKGGSGKTTSCSNIGCALSMMSKRVLIIDGDMQLNLTLSLFDEEKALDYASGGKNIYTGNVDILAVSPRNNAYSGKYSGIYSSILKLYYE
jgi:cellulose biosynthesis protein BcsQ